MKEIEVTQLCYNKRDSKEVLKERKRVIFTNA